MPPPPRIPLHRCDGCGVMRKRNTFSSDNHGMPTGVCRGCKSKYGLTNASRRRDYDKTNRQDRRVRERIQRMAVTRKRVDDGEVPTTTCVCGWELFPEDETCPDCGVENPDFVDQGSGDDFPMSLEYSGAFGVDASGEE